MINYLQILLKFYNSEFQIFMKTVGLNYKFMSNLHRKILIHRVYKNTYNF